VTPDPLAVVIWTVIAFFSGSLMFSLWLGRLALGRDIREVGDGNPGSTNVLKAGGFRLGLLAFLLDYLKGVIPVAAARYGFGIYGFALLPVCFAAMLGHAYSPWVGFRGGKAAAVTMGVWTAITLWEAPTLSGITLGVWFSLLANSGWAMMFTLGCLTAYYIITQPDPETLALAAGTIALIGWKYRADLRKPPVFRAWVLRRLGQPTLR
jgi:glycerol-3-phosphate acyltransferase PlsY